MMKVENLNHDQREVYYDIQQWLKNEKGTVIMLDAPTGTGKTNILSCLATKYGDSTDCIVFRRDQASELQENGIQGYTYISYCMHHFDLPYHHAIKMFKVVNLNVIDLLYDLMKYSLKYSQSFNDIDTIILDTYTVASPSMLLLLYLVSLKKHISLIFAGSKMQQGAISKCRLHSRSNYYIIQILSDLTITKLSKNMRSNDDNFESKLSRFCEMLQSRHPEGDVQFHFELRYLLYCLFQSKYFTEERFDTLYLSQYHHDITERLYRFIDHLTLNGTHYVIEPFMYEEKNNLNAVHTLRHDHKFFPGLLLTKGCKYVYITKSGAHKIVKLEEMFYNEDKKLETLVVRSVNGGTVTKIIRCKLNYYQLLPAYRKWLMPNVKTEVKFWQFPLRIYALTYHAALGQTIKCAQVELSADASNANSIYVGLCSVPNSAAIHKIHATQDLLSFVVTGYMETERQDEKHYYRCPKQDPNRNQILESAFRNGTNEFIDKIQWTTVNSIIAFESKTSNAHLRIKRTLYNQSQKEKTTSLMKVTQFVKSNPSLILDTIHAISNENLTENISMNKKSQSEGEKSKSKDKTSKSKDKTSKSKDKKSKSKDKKAKITDEKSPSYIFLEKAYNSWMAGNEE
ncbi:uncharacterized protein LOC143378632 [Andrena cerasifolii]|uniref:uncharacterized protein LOC143378632 n=1 Tax=Andrena cerasifolii TaxID=2819439 RepID=UPI00403830AB